MKRGIIFLLNIGLTGLLLAQDPDSIEMEKANGFAQPKTLELAVQQFNARTELSEKLTFTELFQAVDFELSNTHGNNDPEFREILLKIVRTRTLPKGALIKVYKYTEESKNDLIFVLLNLHLQSYDLVPEPGSKNLWKKIAVRIKFSK